MVTRHAVKTFRDGPLFECWDHPSRRREHSPCFLYCTSVTTHRATCSRWWAFQGLSGEHPMSETMTNCLCLPRIPAIPIEKLPERIAIKLYVNLRTEWPSLQKRTGKGLKTPFPPNNLSLLGILICSAYSSSVKASIKFVSAVKIVGR